VQLAGIERKNIDTMMQAAVLHAPGDLRIQNVPVPSDISSHEVLVKVFAAGICGSDIGRVMTTGTYSMPMIPGHEFCGMVVTTGNAVSHLVKGDKVVVAPLMPCFTCESCQGGQFGLCAHYNFLGSRTNGGFAQYVKAPARNVLKMPLGIDYIEGATVEPAAVTLHGLHLLSIRAGDITAVIGCGALGFFAIQFARLSGAAEVIAIDIDADKLRLAH
jgi:L-iditol 2-dehydrogenase